MLKIVLGLVLLVLASLAYGSARWESRTQAMQNDLEVARQAEGSVVYNGSELEDLPGPARRYLQMVLPEGPTGTGRVFMEHSGTFNMGESGENWKHFISAQTVFTGSPGFLWNARITVLPGLSVRVHDAYIGGEGILHASLFGLVPVADMRGTPEMARGELMRFLAEAPWYPAVLLPGNGVRWEAVDGSSARATLDDRGISVTLLFRFGDDGLVESVRAGDRGRAVKGEMIPTPWEGRWSRYERRNGMLVPTEGEVAWILPEGPRPYWRGCLLKLVYGR